MSAAAANQTTVTARRPHQFVRRKIALTFYLGQGAFGEGGETKVVVADTDTSKPNNTAIIAPGLRIKASVVILGNSTMGTATLAVHGLSPTVTNQIASIQQAATILKRNRVVVSAGDDIDGMAVVFEGQIREAYVDYAMPDAVLHVSAMAGWFYMLKPPDSVTTFPGSVSVENVVRAIAYEMGYIVNNDGVTALLSSPYYANTSMEKLRRVCADAAIDYLVVQEEKTVVIMPRGKPRSGRIPVISPDTGMIGYPMTAPGLSVRLRTLFNRDVRWNGLVKVESSVKQANGQWQVKALAHELESETPAGGKWETAIEAFSQLVPHAQP